jgi:hypothetical protein
VKNNDFGYFKRSRPPGFEGAASGQNHDFAPHDFASMRHSSLAATLSSTAPPHPQWHSKLR